MAPVRSALHLGPCLDVPTNPDGRVYVNLGSGPTHDPRFINIDATWYPRVHYVAGVERLPMLLDDSVDFLYCSHCLEHIPYQRTGAVLREWVRVLKSGGLLRLAVPDLRAILNAYQDSGYCISAVQSYILGGHDSPYNVHHAVFDATHLTTAMREAGLDGIREWAPGADSTPRFRDYSSSAIIIGDRRYPLSLNLEGTKQ
jgi:predicted SAM-dependent methyltransferase